MPLRQPNDQPDHNEPLFPDPVTALRQAMADLGACAVAFEKIEQGTEATPIHVRKQDARRAYKRAQDALRHHDTRERARQHIAENRELMDRLAEND
jgi:hypothetical protein